MGLARGVLGDMVDLVVPIVTTPMRTETRFSLAYNNDRISNQLVLRLEVMALLAPMPAPAVMVDMGSNAR